jgi:putative transposase
VKSNQAEYAISTQCRTLGVSASGYYAWATRAPSTHTLADVALGDRIETSWRQSRKNYGRPRIQADLRDEGIHVSDKRVARLMRDRSIRGASRRKGFTTTVRDRDARPAPDLVERKFTANAPDQLWVSDITYVPTLSGFRVVDGYAFAYRPRARGNEHGN